MFLGDERSHLGIALERVAKLDALGLFLHAIHELLEDVLLHEHARAGGANFALVDEHTEQRAVGGGFDVGVGEENVG